MKEATDGSYVLTLKQIASWQIPSINEKPAIKASIPSLQRGAVWEPQQIELLWDSIMRGFPIGAIVIAKKIDAQYDKKAITLIKTNATEGITESTHHILDGQQRCNAIAWGFVDPWNEELSDDIVLWLDLKPGGRLKNSTRKYLFRVTTKAHPWGFRSDDQSTNLTVENIRRAMNSFETIHQNKENNYTKPTPRFAFPHDAGLPVPVSLLLKHFDDTKLNGEKLNLDSLKNEPMLKMIFEVKGIEPEKAELELIEDGLEMIGKASLVALQVPDLIKGIEDIEQIFQRLNRQGTPLDNEELSYSVIKAYWPEIEKIISDLPDALRHITEARLVSLGVRVALTESAADKLTSVRNTEQIRKIFKEKTSNDAEHIRAFFEGDSFKMALKWIDDNLLYRESTRSYGVPKYLRSSLAWGSRDVFAWLMLLAKRYEYKQITDEKLTKRIIGIALTIHWFGLDKEGAVNKLLRKHSDLSSTTISILDLLKDDGSTKFIHPPLSPSDVEAALKLDHESTEKQLRNWKGFWHGVVELDKNGDKYKNEDELKLRTERYWNFIEKLKNQTGLLVYAQRDYIEHHFNDFDPSNKLMWKGHNRPWDYDHILPSNNIGGTGNDRCDFTETCQAWKNSLGNLTAVDFAFNRSSQDKVGPVEKYAKNIDVHMQNNNDRFDIFCSNEQLKAFEIKHKETANFQISKAFVLAAKSRFISIYDNWYSALDIGQ